MNLQRKLIIVFCIFGTIAYIAFSQYSLNVQRKDSVSTFSDTGKGMSLFGDLLKELQYGDVNIYRRPLIYYEDLAKFDGVAILSPRLPITEKEAKTIHEFVSNGGKLILSAHDEDTAHRLAPIMSLIAAHSYTMVDQDPEFENFKVRHIVSDIDDEVFKDGETYSFYSQIYFSHRPTCASRKEVSCFYYSQEVGRGLIFYFLGLPLHSNGLLNLEFNRYFAYRMARLAPKLIVDEYHHMFPTKEWMDLAKDWQYSLPLFGLLAGAVLFFVFSRNPERSLRLSEVRSQSLHEVGEKLLVQNLANPNVLLGARERYKRYLEKRFPNWEEDIDYLYRKHYPHVQNDETRIQVQAREFIRLHQKMIKNKQGERIDVLRKPDRQPDL